MSKKKNVPTRAATLTGTVETGAVCKAATTSTHDSTICSAEGQPFRVANLLHTGAENAISRRDLMALTGCSDRELRLKIEAERRQGVPILSNCVGGYYLPADEQERTRFVNSMLHRAMEIAAVAAAVEQAEV